MKGSRELQLRTNLSWCLPAAKPRRSRSREGRKLKLKLINSAGPVFKNAPCPIGPWGRRLGGDEAKAKHLERKKPNCADLVRETDVRRKTTPHGQFASGGGDSHSASWSHVVQLMEGHCRPTKYDVLSNKQVLQQQIY